MAKQGRPYKYSNPDGTLNIKAIQEKIDAYFNDNIDKPVSVPGLRVYLDITSDTFNRWSNGYTDKIERHMDDSTDDTDELYNSELSFAIKKAMGRIEQYLLENTGKNAIKDILALNHSFGYRETKDVNANINVNLNLGDMGDYSK